MVTMRRFRRRRTPMAAAAAAMLMIAWVGATGCEIIAVATLVVDDDGTAPDAQPGDGICEATPGGGDCTLAAAVDEANALGAADLVVPAGEYDGDGDGDGSGLLVTGHITINLDAPQSVKIDGGITTIATGGVLDVDGVTLWGPLVVEGSSIWRRGALSAPDVGVYVSPTGHFVSVSSFIQSGFSAVVRNHGDAVLLQTTVLGFFGGTGIDSGPGARTTLASSAIVQHSFTTSGFPFVACAGDLPTSNGHNASVGSSCDLGSTGDIEGVVDGVEGVPGEWMASFVPVLGSPLLDAVPFGTNGCGTSITTDRLGTARPVDGDSDGVAACDIGAFERTL